MFHFIFEIDLLIWLERMFLHAGTVCSEIRSVWCLFDCNDGPVIVGNLAKRFSSKIISNNTFFQLRARFS